MKQFQEELTEIPERKMKTKTFPQYFAAISAAMGAFVFGTAVSWTAPTTPRLVDKQEYGFVITSEEFSWVAAAVTLGAASVCVVTGYLINWIGRKTTMLLLVLPFTLGWALVIWAQNISMMIVGRVFLGIASGGICVAAPMYTGEIAQKDIRGSLGSFFQLLITIGILFVYVLGAVLNAFWLSFVCGLIPIIFGALVLMCPESPTYLVNKNRDDEAIAALKWLRGDHYNPNYEIAEVRQEMETKKLLAVSIGAAMMKKSSIKAMIISFGLFFFQQMCGINAIIFYTTKIFMDAKTGIRPELCTIAVGVVQIIATFSSLMIVDRLGRRVLLIASDIVMAICLFLLGLYFYLQKQSAESVESLGWLPVTAICVFIIFFSIGFGPVPWLMLGEVFAADIKGLAGSISATLNWTLAFIVSKFFSNLTEAIDIGPTFWLFSGISCLGTVFVYFVVPETKNKSLAEIQTMIKGDIDEEEDTMPKLI